MLNVLGRRFEGPFSIDTTVIPGNRAAVYVITRTDKDGKIYVVDVGESGQIGVRLANHDRRPDWQRHGNGSLAAYARYMPESEGCTAASRRQFEHAIRQKYNPPCGVR